MGERDVAARPVADASPRRAERDAVVRLAVAASPERAERDVAARPVADASPRRAERDVAERERPVVADVSLRRVEREDLARDVSDAARLSSVAAADPSRAAPGDTSGPSRPPGSMSGEPSTGGDTDG